MNDSNYIFGIKMIKLLDEFLRFRIKTGDLIVHEIITGGNLVKLGWLFVPLRDNVFEELRVVFREIVVVGDFLEYLRVSLTLLMNLRIHKINLDPQGVKLL